MDAQAHPTERYRTLDYHTAGEPFRIVVSGVPELPGRTVADRRAFAMNNPAVQRIRALLCSEPRGHADMYGGFLTPPNDEGADVGVLFWHKDGFSTACGHGTIALGVWAVQTGLVRAPTEGSVDVTVDVPSGRVRARVRMSGGRVADVAFVNVPSWVHARDVVVPLPQGPVTVDIAYGGAMYAVLPAATVGLQVRPQDCAALIDAGRAIRAALNAAGAAQHPYAPRLSGIYGTILTGPGDSGDDLHRRNVTVFADGEVDRSPCGSGTAAVVALLDARGELPDAAVLRHESIVGTVFTARVVERDLVDGHPAVVPEVTGTAYRVGSAEFTVDPDDPLVPGFVLR